MGKVVQLRFDNMRRSLLPLTSDSFQRAWALYPEAGRRRSSRAEAWPVWSHIADEIGEDRLEAAVRAYAAKPNDGEPGFHRWLTWGRWDAWLDADAPEIVELKPRHFPGETTRDSFFARFSDPRARDWLDRCDRTDGLNTFVGSREEPKPSQEWLDGPFKKWLRTIGCSHFRWRYGDE